MIPDTKIQDCKELLQNARWEVKNGNLSLALLTMKWAMEKLLPDGEQYCSQTLSDGDPDKTLQGYLDNIREELRITSVEDLVTLRGYLANVCAELQIIDFPDLITLRGHLANICDDPRIVGTTTQKGDEA